MTQHRVPQGVRVPENQSTERAPVLTVTNFQLLQVGLVEYGDERGRLVNTVCFVSGDKAFIPPNGEQWTQGFRSFVEKIAGQIMQRVHEINGQDAGAPTPTVPASDAVDIMSFPVKK
jgi:hypothetical protein